MSDIYIAAFDKYFLATGDTRAADFVKFIRYGTNNPSAILLIRYGFSPEGVDLLIPHIQSISEDEIVFRPSVTEVENEFDSYLIDHYS